MADCVKFCLFDLNVFYLKEKDWEWHCTWHRPLRKQVCFNPSYPLAGFLESLSTKYFAWKERNIFLGCMVSVVYAKSTFILPFRIKCQLIGADFRANIHGCCWNGKAGTRSLFICQAYIDLSFINQQLHKCLLFRVKVFFIYFYLTHRSGLLCVLAGICANRG